MRTDKEVMQMALNALLDAREVMTITHNDRNAYEDEIEALLDALAPPMRPVKTYCGGIPNYVLESEPNNFCDTHCTWMDHHPDCKLSDYRIVVRYLWAYKVGDDWFVSRLLSEEEFFSHNDWAEYKRLDWSRIELEE